MLNYKNHEIKMILSTISGPKNEFLYNIPKKSINKIITFGGKNNKFVSQNIHPSSIT
jgi:hypothetical protein